jgi:hypothetical protein
MERWFGSLRRECLDRLLIVGRRHVVRVLHDYVVHPHCIPVIPAIDL